MPLEIERKFLVNESAWQSLAAGASARYICQGYLNRDKERTIRIRIFGNEAFLTIKGLTTGATRKEYEYGIPLEDARELLELCERPLIEKNRHLIENSGLVWEVDEFLGDNEGLVVAEIELQSEDQPVDLPPWIGTEVTDDPRYYNSNLIAHPFRDWSSTVDEV